MRLKRGLQVTILSLILVSMMVLMSGCNLVPRLLNLVRGVAEEHLDEDEIVDQVLGEEEEEEEGEEEEPEVTVDNWQNPTEMNEFIEMFERLQWSWVDVRDEAETGRHTAIYEHRGTEEIDGEDTTEVMISFDDDEVTFWLGEDEEVVQAEFDGEIVSGEMGGQLISAAEGAFWPFAIVDQLDPDEIFTGTGYGWEWEVVDTSVQTFGQMQAEVTHVQVNIGPPIVEADDEITVEWGIGDFGDFQMLVHWEAKEGGEGQQWGLSIEVEDVVPR